MEKLLNVSKNEWEPWTCGIQVLPTVDNVERCFIIILVSCCSVTMGTMYEQEKDEDGFLYVAYSGENTFGH